MLDLRLEPRRWAGSFLIVVGIVLIAPFAWAERPPAEPSPARADHPLDALLAGHVYGDVRYRFETVRDDRYQKDSYAGTVRSRLGYLTAPFRGMTAAIEILAATPLLPDQSNDSMNGKTDRPLIADPGAVRINQAYVSIPLGADFTLKGMRQSIGLNNERFVGTKSGRVIDQVFDAVTVTGNPGRGLTATYNFVFGVERSFGPFSPQGHWDITGHFFNIMAKPAEGMDLRAYVVEADIVGRPDISSTTLGTRVALQGKNFGWLIPSVNGEVAAQFAKDDGEQTYLLLEPGIGRAPANLRLGFERLSGNGERALQTPLATVNAFNGWVTKFASTPKDGLVDLYASFVLDPLPLIPLLPDAKLQVLWHNFSSDHGSSHYGDEFDFGWSQTLADGLSGNLRFSRYFANEFASDTDKLSYVLQYAF